ncbi:MAG TPA: TldD/PmbA family protein [Candidatus Bathyarchaeia archaeon]|jgi:PmbA protein|nr:TldD/PmbA family protein [Candidatus Bathyarchaeia archaeon]
MSDVLAKTEEIVKKAKALGADEVLATTTFGKYRQVRFSGNQVDITVAWDDYVTDVALAWQKRVVGTRIHNFEDVDGSVKKLFGLAKVSQENPMFGGFAKGKFKYATSKADKKLAELENPTEYVFEAVEAAKKEAGSDIDSGGILFTKFEDIYLASSEGAVGADSRSAVEFSIRAFAQREASGHGVECSSTLKDFKPAKAGTKAGMIAKLAKNPKIGDEGVYDVIFDPLIYGSSLGVYAMMFSAYSILVQMSVFVDKLGKKVAPEIVTMRDNPAAYSVSNRVFDDEGYPTKENVLIDRGVLKGFLHNTSTAKIFKTETTGNAGLVAPNAWSLELDAGKMSKDEVFKETKRGLYLTNTWYTRFQNYAKGDFSTIPRDGIFLVEKGEITQSLKDLRISDNVLTMLGNIAAISKERQHVHWWGEADPPSLSPYVLVKDVHMTKSK